MKTATVKKETRGGARIGAGRKKDSKNKVKKPSKDRKVGLRFYQEDYDRIEQAAKMAGVTVSDLIEKAAMSRVTAILK